MIGLFRWACPNLRLSMVIQVRERGLSAEELAGRIPEGGLALYNSEEGLILTDGRLSMKGDFSEMLSRLKHNNLSHELVVKAAKIKSLDRPLNIIDATAGMGEDSLLLAAAGHNVTMYEYDPVIAALLKDTLERAMHNPELEMIASRMTLIEGDSIEAMRRLGENQLTLQSVADGDKETDGTAGGCAFTDNGIDVILLDPMFPQRQKSGLIKKKFQLLQQLESPCSNEDEMLEAALSSGARRVIIKRPAKGPFLGGRKPDYSIEGKAVRYDCHVLRT